MDAVVRAVSERRLVAVLVRKDLRSSVMERAVDLMEVWGAVKADVVARMARRAMLRKVFIVADVLSLLFDL